MSSISLYHKFKDSFLLCLAAVRPHFNGQWDDYRMLRHRVIFNSKFKHNSSCCCFKRSVIKSPLGSTSVLSRRSQRSVQASLGRLWCVTIRNRVVRLCNTPLNIWALPGFSRKKIAKRYEFGLTTCCIRRLPWRNKSSIPAHYPFRPWTPVARHQIN